MKLLFFLCIAFLSFGYSYADESHSIEKEGNPNRTADLIDLGGSILLWGSVIFVGSELANKNQDFAENALWLSVLGLVALSASRSEHLSAKPDIDNTASIHLRLLHDGSIVTYSYAFD